LTPHIDTNDKILVMSVTGRSAAWKGFTPEIGKWIKDNL
jgi:hypothetical protein